MTENIMDIVKPTDLRALLRFLIRSPRTIVRSEEMVATLHAIFHTALVSDVYEMPNGGFTARITEFGRNYFHIWESHGWPPDDAPELHVGVDPAKGKDYSVEHSLESLGDGGFGALSLSRLLGEDD